LFPITNGQVVAELSAEGVSFAGADRIGTVQVRSSRTSGTVISSTAVATVPVRFVAPAAGGTVTFTPPDVLADRAGRLSSIVITGLVDAAGRPLPDGTKVALTVVNNTALHDFQWMQSAGGKLLTANVTPGDGDPSPSSSSWRLFTVAGGEVRATYSPDSILLQQGQTSIARVGVAPVNVNGTVLTSTVIAHGAINLRAATSAVASGPATMARNSTATVTFSGIKDSAGNTLPDGAKVIVVAASNQFFDAATNTYIQSISGVRAIDGAPSPTSSAYAVYTVSGGAITATIQTGSSTGIARVLIAPADINGANIGNRALAGGIWPITVQ
jgi:hypothetical protein